MINFFNKTKCVKIQFFFFKDSNFFYKKLSTIYYWLNKYQELFGFKTNDELDRKKTMNGFCLLINYFKNFKMKSNVFHQVLQTSSINNIKYFCLLLCKFYWKYLSRSKNLNKRKIMQFFGTLYKYMFNMAPEILVKKFAYSNWEKFNFFSTSYACSDIFHVSKNYF